MLKFTEILKTKKKYLLGFVVVILTALVQFDILSPSNFKILTTLTGLSATVCQ